MTTSLLALGALALLLGFKHAYDADHLVAVSNLLTRSPGLRRTGVLSLAWAAGHMVTAGALTVALFYFRETLLAGFLAHLEVAVAVMLVVLGAVSIYWETPRVRRSRGGFDEVGAPPQAHMHRHVHLRREHEHPHIHPLRRLQERLQQGGDRKAMATIGVIHGIASNDELLILFTASLSVTSLGGILAGVGIFSIGVVLGMVLFGFALTAPIVKWGSERVRRVANIGAGSASIAYGAFLLLGGETLNPFEGLLAAV